MIHIDYAGSGSFVGGTCIGLYRPETNEYFFDIIPVELYNKENFKKKLYLDEVVNIAERGFAQLKVRDNETIEICRGYMFEKLKLWLEDRKFFWYSTHITGRVQDIVEKNFQLYAENLGLPRQYIKYTNYPFHFHKLLRWVFADIENRLDLCKVGWKCWSKISGTEPEVLIGTMDESRYYCLKCGKHIKKGSKIKILKYYSNCEQRVFLHHYC